MAESQKLEIALCLFSIIVMDENPNQLLNKFYWNACFCGINIMILSIRTNWRLEGDGSIDVNGFGLKKGDLLITGS